jgi:hypothetical protein
MMGPPVLEGKQDVGAAVTVIPLRLSGQPRQLVVSPSDYVKFNILTGTNPECNTQRFIEVSLVLDGKRYPLKAFEARFGCFEPNLDPWERAEVPNETNYGAVTRAPK